MADFSAPRLAGIRQGRTGTRTGTGEPRRRRRRRPLPRFVRTDPGPRFRTGPTRRARVDLGGDQGLLPETLSGTWLRSVEWDTMLKFGIFIGRLDPIILICSECAASVSPGTAVQMHPSRHDAGRFSTDNPGRHSVAGRIGLGWNPPPQFGQTLCSFVSTQSAQNVHSYVQIRASVALGGRSLSQNSQWLAAGCAIPFPLGRFTPRGAAAAFPSPRAGNSPRR